MDRRLEKTAAIIGLVLQGIVIGLVVPIMFFVNVQFPQYLPGTYELWFAWFVFGVHVLGLMLGLVAFGRIKKNVKQAGIYFIATGMLMALFTIGATAIQSLCFVIAGLGCLLRQRQGEFNIS